MGDPLLREPGWVRGFVDTTGTIHAMQRGGWSLCGRRRRKSWYENASGFILGGGPECDSCSAALHPPLTSVSTNPDPREGS